MDCPVLAFNLRLPAKEQKQTNKQTTTTKQKRPNINTWLNCRRKNKHCMYRGLKAHFKWRPFEVDQPDSIIFQYLKLRMPITS